MKFIFGKKIGMTQVFLENGTVVPVTRIQAGPCVVTQIKTKGADRADSVQVGFGEQKVFRLNRAEQGHLKGISKGQGLTVRYLREVPMTNDADLKRGDIFTVKVFAPGEKVQVVGTAKGKGFQGVVKRHGFAGGPASHGHKDNLRMPGSIGAGGVQRVFKGMRMAGHMGDQQVTVKNLEVIEVKNDTNELWIKGAVPGARNSVVLVSTPEGKIEVEAMPVEPVAETIQPVETQAPAVEAPATEPAATEVVVEEAPAEAAPAATDAAPASEENAEQK